ncbi:glycosyltransferase family 4 protein [Massilia sp. YIM B02769]|uniref:glycosyltransferase family 4 protein n=1 Tax=unclassified Massilia TaxID=2609279 RepID=UPI0025B6A5EF|nr:glycosyltransferase family 4 protein [Massilia sp.]MDN4059330.1 glycosyltransferase family 4 protein [Massilia sp. YIM B02769]
MRILLVSEDLPGEQIGGLGKHVVTLGNALLAHGHAVRILGRSDRSDRGCAGGKGGAGTDPARQIGFLGSFVPGFDYAHPGWKESQLGIFNPLKRPYFARKIGTAINRHAADADVVHYHGHLPMVGLHVAPGMNYVQTRHDQGSECLTHLRFRDDTPCITLAPRDCSACICAHAGPLRKSVTAIAVNRYREDNARAFAMHKTVFVSHFLRRQFLRVVPHADLARCRVIPNFVDYPRLAAILDTALAPVAGRVVLVGRVDAGKGFGEFLAAAHARLPELAQVLVAGDGPERAALEVRHAGAQVRFLGWQDYPAALSLAASAHVCVVPSVCEEACSTTVLEALALGRPCIALARGGTPELSGFQRYPGQLQLARSMPELVERLRSQLAAAPTRLPPAASFGADAAHILPRLLELYAD